MDNKRRRQEHIRAKLPRGERKHPAGPEHGYKLLPKQAMAGSYGPAVICQPGSLKRKGAHLQVQDVEARHAVAPHVAAGTPHCLVPATAEGKVTLSEHTTAQHGSPHHTAVSLSQALS